MKVIAFNGSPRKAWNTATLLKKALEGATSQGAETEFIHLYDLNFKGCKSCFACKTKGGKSYGRCALQDDLAPILKQVEETDALVLGSPIYFGTVSGEMKSKTAKRLSTWAPDLPGSVYRQARGKAVRLGWGPMPKQSTESLMKR